MPKKTRLKGVKRTETATPQWFVFAVIASMTFMLCLAINFRAFTEMRAEIQQNESLNIQLEQLTNENLAIQDEIYSLKNNPRTIEREARKIGLGR